MARKKYVEKTFDLSEEETQQLIKGAKDQDFVAQTRLLEVYDNFLSKYVAMLYYGKWSIKDKDLRRFLSFFVTDKGVRFHLRKKTLNNEGYRHVNEVLRGITYMVNRYGDEDDVRQTVQVTFLQCIMRYEPRKSKQGGMVPFSGYLYVFFLYFLKRNIEEFLIDQLGRKTFPLIEDEELGAGSGMEDDGPKPEGFTAPPDLSAEELIGPDEINEFWVTGETAFPPFDALTIQERQLLKWRFADGLRSSEIALKITEHPNTVREHFSKIKEKIKHLVSLELQDV